jgi:hypothetical protein
MIGGTGDDTYLIDNNRVDNRRADELQRAGFHVFRFTDEDGLCINGALMDSRGFPTPAYTAGTGKSRLSKKTWE